METRLDYQKAFPEGVQGMLHLEAIIAFRPAVGNYQPQVAAASAKG